MTTPYVQPEGNDTNSYVEDSPLTPATLSSGALGERLDEVEYPQRNVEAPDKVGNAKPKEPGDGGPLPSEKDTPGSYSIP